MKLSKAALATLCGLSMSCTPAAADVIGLTESGAAWQKLTLKDVRAFCTAAKDIHPGMRDPMTPEFAANVENACAEAEGSTTSIDTFGGWRATIETLATSFRDGHLGVSFSVEPVRVSWAGFLVDGRHDGYVVRYPEGLTIPEGVPPEGARVVSCHGLDVADMMDLLLDEQVADLSKEPERLRQAYNMFIDRNKLGYSVPLEQCVFETAGGRREMAIEWHSISAARLDGALGPFTRSMTRDIGLAWMEDGGAWISLGNAQDEGALESLETEMIRSAGRLRGAPYVVFDLRGSRGGNSMWGDRLAYVLWGKDAVDGRRLAAQSDDPLDHGKYWRSSPRAALEIRNVSEEFEIQGEDMAEAARFWRELADTIEQRPEGDQSLYRDACCRPRPRPHSVPAPEYDGRAFVLTDAGTFSSSVVVMNTLKRMGAVQIGEPSGQNEKYVEYVGPFSLLSGLGTYRIPVSLIRQPRRDLGGLPPDIRWTGAMDDDGGLKAWVSELAKRPLDQ